ncbi:Lyase [Nostocoides japonicum T1-X7]|uniref:Lyase n=1 Tax=Nostocoides japonicum T1-X7 TaxID=1194083 RepID=A0A077LUM5_9MICO|nr:VOC family protein [Tetrasphaera japonica]CCH77573.1 Lyase [Tetrasphaera japonica T1-X7]
MDFRIELVPINVSDVDRAKAFYASLGWTADHDERPSEDVRFVQITPPGSACSFCFGTGLGMLDEGHIQHIQVVVEDADEVLAYLRDRVHDIDCSDVKELPWGRFVHLADPDGNLWSFQQLPARS